MKIAQALVDGVHLNESWTPWTPRQRHGGGIAGNSRPKCWRNDNKMAYAYLLTTVGLSEKVNITKRFLARKETEFDQLQAIIISLRAELHANVAKDKRS